MLLIPEPALGQCNQCGCVGSLAPGRGPRLPPNFIWFAELLLTRMVRPKSSANCFCFWPVLEERFCCVLKRHHISNFEMHLRE